MFEALRPIAGFALRAPIVILLLVWPIVSQLLPHRPRRPRHALAIGCALIACLAAIKVGIYLAAPTPLDHVAVQILCVSRGWLDGMPLYHALDAPVRYSLLYGPLPYLFAGAILALVPASAGLTAVKVGFAGCWVLAVAAVARAARRAATADGDGALRGAIVTGALSLVFGRLAFTARPDALLLLAAATGLWIALRSEDGKGRALTAVFVGALAGLATASKLHGVIYLFPAIAVLGARRARSVAIAAVAAVAAALVPFALGGVDLDAHLTLLRSATRHGLSGYLVAVNLSLALFLFVPALVDPHRASREARWRRAGLALALVGAAIIGGKTGAGPSHLIGLLPATALDWSAALRTPLSGWRRSLASAWMLSLAIVLAAGLWFERGELAGAIDRNEAEELRQLGETLAADGPVQLAPSDAPNGVRVAGLSPWLVLGGGPYDFDLASLSDLSAAGVPLAVTAHERLRRCTTRHWLVPRGSAPFSARSLYPPHGPLFDDEFRNAFRHGYGLTRTNARFDVWSCRP